MSINADSHGLLFEVLCLVQNPLYTPTWQQQVREWNLIMTLRSEDGDWAYVPTTTVYTGLDQIVTDSDKSLLIWFNYQIRCRIKSDDLKYRELALEFA